ncbi:MAG TPA: xanthine dehydrogenase family protein molybdopterin-binding subunit [Burkholderiaceae bacterium]
MATEPKKKSRRRFILGGLGVAGALVVGWGVMPPRQRINSSNPLPTDAGEIALNGWIKIAADGTVIVAMPRAEMGQGVHTALPMLVAEELDVPLASVKIVQAPMDKIFGNVSMLADGLPFHPDDTGAVKRTAQWLTAKTARELGLVVTGGSSSVKDAWGPMREAGASARAMLVAAAAARWSVDPDSCQTADGAVSHSSGKRATYAELMADAAHSKPGKIRLKDPQKFTLIGTPQPRRDSAAKVNGTAGFGIDARPPGMVYAAVRMSPTIGGSVQKFDATAVLGMPGVISVVDFSPAGGVAGIAVLAKTFWQAKQAVAALPITWNAGPNATLSSADVFKELAAKIDNEGGFTYYKTGDMSLGAGAATTLKAEYQAPFLAHATMEPINCTAQVKDGKVTLWLSTQVPSVAVGEAAKVAGVKAENVELHMTYIGGGFGRRLEVDMVKQAVAIARQAGGVPVQVLWTREEDMTHDMYRPAALARFTATMDGQGKVLSYDNKSASGSITHQVLTRTFGIPGSGPDKTTAEGEFDMSYEFPNQHIAHVIVPTPVPLGYWRSVGHSHNAFFKESFIDELAHAAKQDPVAFRRSLLTRQPRFLAVLDAAVEKAGKPELGHALGVALHRSFGTIVAQVAEVSVENNEIKVHKVTCAVDCGIAVNPNIIAQQVESAINFGLSAALFGEATIKDGQIEQQNFDTYPVIRMMQSPQIETIVIKSAEPPEGMGEPATPPIAPAVANAVFILTGKRLRSLPLKLA